MSNEKRAYIYSALYNIGFMFCTGAIVQTFFLQIGFSEQQVYLYNSLIQAAQVVMMLVPILVFVFTQSNIVETMGSSGMKD